MGPAGGVIGNLTRPRRSGRLPLVVALVTVVVFLPVLANGFVSWDDEANFLTNPAYRGLGAAQLRWMWTTRHLGHYVPLSWMTLGADYLLWGLRPLGYHLTNLVLHTASAVLLFAIARRLLVLAGAADGPRLSRLAAFAALLFAIHPLRVESVAWATERRDVLCGFFFFLAVYAYLRARASAPSRRWFAAALVSAAAALLSKAMAVTLPPLLLLLDIYPLRRLGGAAGWTTPAARRVYLEKVPFILLAGAAAIGAFAALGAVPQLSPAGKVAVSLYGLGFSLRATVVPIGLAPLYPMPPRVNPLAPGLLLSYLLVLAMTVAAVLARRRRPALPAAWAAFTLLLLPVLGLHQNGPQIAADRYTYLAGAVAGLLVASAAAGARRPALADAAVAAWLVLLGALTWRQTGFWHDSGRLWARVLAVSPASAIAHNNLGNVFAGEGRLAEAEAEYRRALEADPRYAEAHNDLGAVLTRLGRPAEAIPHYREALALAPRYAEAHVNWGGALAGLGRPGEAIDHYRQALALEPGNVAARINWGNALVRAGRPADAVEQYRLAAALHPGDADAHDNWGVALMQLGRPAEAAAHFREAAAARPGDADIGEHLRRAEATARP